MSSRRVFIFSLDIVLGFVFVIFNFDGFMRHAAHNWSPNRTITDLIIKVSRWPAQFIPTSQSEMAVFLHDVMVLCFYGIWIYLGIVALLAIVRMNQRIVGSGLLGFTSGASTIAILSWLGLLLIAIAGMIIAIVRFLGVVWNFIIRILGPIFKFIFDILAAIWGFLWPIISFLLPYIFWLIVIGIVLWIIVEIVRALGYKSILIAVIIGAVGYLFWPQIIIIWHKYIEPIVMWILNALMWILGIIGSIFLWIYNAIIWLVMHLIPIAFVTATIGVILIIVGTAGAFLVDQIRAAWHNGSGHKGVLLGSFSVGLALALIIWVSSGSPVMASAIDQAWQETAFVAQTVRPTQIFDVMLPESVREISHQFFVDADAPNFDALVLALILPISYFGLLRGMVKRYEDEFRATFISQDILIVAGAIALAIPAIILVLLSVLVPRDQ